MIKNQSPGYSPVWDRLCELSEEQTDKLLTHILTKTAYSSQQNKIDIIMEILEDMADDTDQEEIKILEGLMDESNL